jgi:hypothetical protein
MIAVATAAKGTVIANAPASETRLIGQGRLMRRPKKPASPFRYFNSSPEIIRLVVMMYVRFPLSLRNVEDLLAERGNRYLSRDGEALVEPFRAAICSRYQSAEDQQDARLSSLALALR